MKKKGAVINPEEDKTVEKEATVETERMTETGVVAEIEGIPGIPTVQIMMGLPTNETIKIKTDCPPEHIKGINKTMAIDHHPHHILKDPITEVTVGTQGPTRGMDAEGHLDLSLGMEIDQEIGNLGMREGIPLAHTQEVVIEDLLETGLQARMDTEDLITTDHLKTREGTILNLNHHQIPDTSHLLLDLPRIEGYLSKGQTVEDITMKVLVYHTVHVVLVLITLHLHVIMHLLPNATNVTETSD